MEFPPRCQCQEEEERFSCGKQPQLSVDKLVDNILLFVEKWVTTGGYAQSFCFIPSTLPRKWSFVDNS